MKKLLVLICLIPFFGSSYSQSLHIRSSDTTICAGTSVVFRVTDTISGAAHFQWQVNSNNVGIDTSVYITNTLNNDDTVRCLLVNGSHDTVRAVSNAIIMIVDTIPDAGIITGLGKVCVGANVTLTDTVGGGLWYATNPHASVVNGIVTGVEADFFECPMYAYDTILYVVSNSFCSDTAYYKVTIAPQPFARAVVGSSVICPYPAFNNLFGEPYCINDFYFVKTDSDEYRTAADLYLVASNECGKVTEKYDRKFYFYHSFRDTPVISIAASEICAGVRIKVSAPAGNYKQAWGIVGNSASIGSDTGGVYILGKKAGSVSVILQYTNICGPSLAKPDTVTVLVHPQPAHDSVLSDFCIGGSEVFTDSITGGAWSSSDEAVATINSITGVATGAGEGRAVISYTATGGCYGTRKIAVTDCGGDVEVYPVPANEQLIVRSFADGRYSNYSLINTVGQILFEHKLNGEYTIVNTQALSKGVYFLRLSGKKTHKTLKFQKD